MEVWKALGPKGNEVLLKVLNTCLQEKIPEGWATTITVPIFKKGDKEIPKNYRPISLLNTVTKLFTCLLANRIQKLAEDKGIIHDNQAAYRKGRGCEDHIYTLNTLIQKQLSQRDTYYGRSSTRKAKYKKLYACFIDLAAAFDSCDHQLLWTRLEEEGLSTKIIMKIKEIYVQAKTRIRTGEGLSEHVKIMKGVLQGETLSPTLFSLFLNKIVTELEQEEINGVKLGDERVTILLYADDQVLVSTHPRGLQNLINRTASLFTDMKLKVNLAKTKVIVFRRGGRLPDDLRFHWEGETVEIVNEYVYLGVKFSSSGLFAKAKRIFFQKAQTALQNLQALIRKTRTTDVQIAHKLFVSLVASILSYGAPVWGLQYIDEVEKFQTRFLRWFYGLTNSTPGFFIRLEAGITNIRCYVFKSILNFLFRVFNSSSKLMKGSLKESQACKCEDKRYNWWEQIKRVFTDAGLTEEVKRLNEKYITENYKSMLARFSQNATEKDIEHMKKDYRFEAYKLVKTHIGPSEYMKSDLEHNVKRLLIKLRSTLPRIVVRGKTVNLNAIWRTWKGGKEYKETDCELCNLKETEDVLHVMLRCPQYSQLRCMYLSRVATGTTSVSNRETEFELTCKLIYSREQNTWMNMYNFWLNAVKIRELYTGLMESDD